METSRYSPINEGYPCDACKGQKGTWISIDGWTRWVNCPICQGRGYTGQKWPEKKEDDNEQQEG